MENKGFGTPSRKESIYTLGLDRTNNIGSAPKSPNKVVSGKGTERDKDKALKGRAKRKFITQKLVLDLIDIAKEKQALHRVKKYWDTYHCQSSLTSSEGKIYGTYCGNRWCTLCCSIRKAKIINTYLPIVKTWPDPHFVTLTVRTIKAKNLKKWIEEGLLLFLSRLLDKYRKREKRGKGNKFVGIRSLECNYNPKTQRYNPHFHITVATKEMGDILVQEWLEKWTYKHAESVGQDNQRVNNSEAVMIEILKYGGKIFTDPDMKKGKNSKIPPKIYAAALDHIYGAFEGHRLFDNFGFRLPPKPKKEKHSPKLLNTFEEWAFDKQIHDWVNPHTGELLTGFVPSGMLEFLMYNNIDTEMS